MLLAHLEQERRGFKPRPECPQEVLFGGKSVPGRLVGVPELVVLPQSSEIFALCETNMLEHRAEDQLLSNTCPAEHPLQRCVPLQTIRKVISCSQHLVHTETYVQPLVLTHHEWSVAAFGSQHLQEIGCQSMHAQSFPRDGLRKCTDFARVLLQS